MKHKLLKIGALLAVPAVLLSVTGCSSEGNAGYIMYDYEVAPTVTAPYADESQAVLSQYFNGNMSATEAAAALYAYGCYNEEYLDSYVYFSNQVGTTDLGSNGKSTATKQDYKLIIHESDDTCGYKYHYTIKKVDSCSGTIANFKTSFESCRLRFVKDTNVLYRFNGSNVHYDGNTAYHESSQFLTCDWSPDASDWGTSDDEPSIVKRDGEKLDLEGIKTDIVDIGTSYPSDAVIHGNINILADNVIESATIDDLTSSYGCYYISMTLDVDVANSDSASSSMLQESNSSSNCSWDKLSINYTIWPNGMLRTYIIYETWSGRISGFSGSVDSTTSVYYSYSERDTDITDKLTLIEGSSNWWVELPAWARGLLIAAFCVLGAGIIVTVITVPIIETRKRRKQRSPSEEEWNDGWNNFK